MIYINTSTNLQEFYVPVTAPTQTAIFRLVGTVNKQEVYNSQIENKINSAQYFLARIAIEQSGIEAGEYEYTLTNTDGVIVGCGLADVGSYGNRSVEEYNNPITYEQYEQ